jgi:nucleoid-associated protein YgaU
MENTLSGLVPARIIEVERVTGSNEVIFGSLSVPCMFNPYEYTITKSNSFSEKSDDDKNSPEAELSSSGPQTLQLKLVFDTYESGKDVSLITNDLWKFMLKKDPKNAQHKKKRNPPQVAFVWGGFEFVSYVTNMTQTFTLFLPDGTPVRASVDVQFTQYTDRNDYPKQNPTSGSRTSEKVWKVVAGDRLDAIAAEVLGDAAQWRSIAEHNHISDPLALKPGRLIHIPLG